MKKDPALSSIPVIILTARASLEDRILGLTRGADDYLPKPIVSDEMVLRIRNTLSRLDLARTAAEKEMMESTLAAAQEVHGSLGRELKGLPGSVSISNHYEPAEITSGDWFGLNYDEEQNRLYIFVGDVTGHGTTAALVTVAVAGAVKGLLSVMKMAKVKKSMEETVNIIAQSINNAVKDTGDKIDRSMSMAFVCLDLNTGEGYYLNAGHNKIYLIGQERVKSMLKSGNPLGFSEEADFGKTSFSLQNGDSLFLYTDGLLENEGPDGEVFRDMSLKKILSEKAESIDEIKSNVLGAAKVVWKDAIPEDDCTFLIVKWDKHGTLGEVA